MVYTFVEKSLDEVIAKIESNDVFSLDLETTGLSPLDSRIILCQIAFLDGDSYVIDTSQVNVKPLMPFFVKSKWLKIIQQSKFERKFIYYNFNTKINNVFDTFLAEKLLTTEQKTSSSLETLALKYANKQLNKKIRLSFTESRPMNMFSDEQLQYASDDVTVLFPIWQEQEKLLKEKQIFHIAKIEFEVAQVVAHMELVGVPVLQDKWKKILEETKQEHEESRLKMNALLFDSGENQEQIGMFVRDSINLNSPKQLKAAFQKIGIDLEATNEREIGLIDHPAAKELLHYRGLQKTLSAYGETFLGSIHSFTGRIHADFIQLGTETGRFSCKEPNLQQLPDSFRQCIGAKEFAIIAADYSQIELRILAELSEDKNFLEAFRSGQDLHIATAATIFGIPTEKVTKEQRFIAKTINFGLAYGMGANKLLDILNAEAEKNGTKRYTVSQARTFLANYRVAYKDVITWLTNAGVRAVLKGYSETMMGRKRFFKRPAQGISTSEYDMQIAGIKRQGANAPIQGTNADITKLAMIEIDNELTNYGFSANIIIQVHDEIVILARKEEAEAVKNITVAAMEVAAQRVLTKVPVLVEAYVSDVWKKG